ncbi:potassium-transporting ATPase subunit F [Streptomyces sp. T1317-0309]|nr:potassium-transporting ATPase subunit F [Streptomyces sp. T1317-0309]
MHGGFVVDAGHGRPATVPGHAGSDRLRRVLQPVHSFSTGRAGAFTAPLPVAEPRCIRGRYLGCDRNRRFPGRNARPYSVLGASVSATDVLLLVLSFVMFIYLGVALFKAERF